LFRIDTEDLDSLYNKIAQCTKESDKFVHATDHDIN
jgi:hypothetical protein